MSSTEYTTILGSGRICPGCGSWIPHNAGHACTRQWPSHPTPAQWDRMSDIRIAEALEAIAAELKDIKELLAARGRSVNR